MTWSVNLTDADANLKWNYVKIMSLVGASLTDLVRFTNTGQKTILNSNYQSRGTDLTSNITQNGSVVTIMFTMANLRTTDEMNYRAVLGFPFDSTIYIYNTLLVVQVLPESTSISISPNQTIFCRGSLATISCTSYAKPPANYSLYHNTKLVHDNSTSGVFSVTLNDTGNKSYACVPYNTVGVGQNRSLELLIKEPPKAENCTVVSKNMINGAVVEGEIVTLLCNDIIGSDPLNITWTNGRQVWNRVNLTFGSVNRVNNGNYHVTVNNGKECNEAKGENLTLIVYFLPESTSINISPNQTSFCRGSLATISCTSYSKPPAKYALYHNTKQVHDNSTSGVFSVILNDTGNDSYSCAPYNILGFGQNRSVPLFVKEPPNIDGCHVASINMINGSVIEGETVTLLCNDISGSDPLNITWTDGSQVWNRVNLTFNSVNRKNTGNYHMTVNNGKECNKTATENLTLSVYFPPTIIVLVCQGCQSGVAVENQTITLLCNATGKPMPNIRWMKNGEYYNGSSSVSSPMNKLVFQTFAISDTGIYTCIADNGVGNPGRKSFLLSVKYRPENTSIKISDEKKVFCKGDSIHVTCTSHAKPAPVYSLYRSTVFLGSNAVGIFVVELAENGNYSFTCVPNNAVGVGPSKSESVTVKEPPKITNCRINGSLSTIQPVVEGDVVIVRCSASGSPPLTGRWTKDGRMWNGSDLIFNPIHREDAGFYKFILHNGDECNKTEQTLPISVYYIDPLEVIGSSNKSYSQSNPLVLFNLSINAYPSNTSLSCNPSLRNILTAITSHDAGLTGKQYLVFAVIQKEVESASIVCKAENGVGVRERTLHFYRQPILFKETFTGQFRVTNQEWQDDLQDVKSASYDDLKQKCIKTLEAAYSGVQYLAAVKIKDFIKGSIIVRFELEVIGKVPDPLLPLKDYIKTQGEEINGLQIDSIQKSNDFKENTQIPCKEENKTLVAVLGVLFGLSIVLIIILIVGFLWLRRKDSKGISGKKSNTSDERGHMNDISLQETSFNATDNETPNVPEYEPIGRRGLSTSNAGIPEYEAVTTKTRPRQPHSGIQTNNPMPQYESTDQHGQTGASSNSPPVTYQTIQPRTGNYDSLSPFTRLSPRGTVMSSTGSPTRTGEYQAIQRKGVSPQYQSLDGLSKC